MTRLPFAIIDPHIHQWDPYHTPHAAAQLVKYFGRHPQLMQRMMRLLKPKALLESLGRTDLALKPYLPADYALDAAPHFIESVIHVEANWHHQQDFAVVEETRWITQLPFAEQNIKLAGIVATADPRHAQFKAILAAHQAASPQFCGIRKMAAWHADTGVHRWCEHPHLYRQRQFLQGFEHLAALNLSFDAWGYSTQLPDIIHLAQHFPDTRIMLDHLATPVGVFGPVGKHTGQSGIERANIFAAWQEHISRLAEQPQVYAKISGLMMPVLGHRFYQQQRVASRLEMVELLQPFIEHAIQAFGIHRLVFASNFPMDKANCDLASLIDAYIDILQSYGEAACYQIFRQNALDFYLPKQP